MDLETNGRGGLHQGGDESRSTKSIRVNGAKAPAMGSLDDIPRRKVTMHLGRRRKAITISAFVALVSVIVVVSSIALGPSAKEQNKTPARTDAPGTPFYVVGFTYEESPPGSGILVKLASVSVTITNQRTAESVSGTSGASGPTLGSFMIDMQTNTASGVLPGDTFSISAVKAALSGTNVTTVGLPNPVGLAVYLNCTLTTGVIPEFGTLLVPIVGMFGIVAAVSLIHSRKKS